MPFDPLFLEAPMPAALRAELGIAPAAELFYVRFPTPQWPLYDPRLEGYQVVSVLSLDPDAEGKLPQTWAPGFQPHRFRLARIRFRDDSAYGELRWSDAAGLYAQVRWPTLWEGRGPLIAEDEWGRALWGLRALWDQLPSFGRLPDAVRAPALVAGRRGRLLNALIARYRFGTPDDEITQALIADDLHISVRTLQYWRERVHQRWDALKAEARVQAPLSDTADPSP